MSIENAKAFAQKVLESKELGEKVLALRGTLEERTAGVVKLGAAQKLTFTEDEIRGVVLRLLPGNRELSDDELEKVAGGAIDKQLDPNAHLGDKYGGGPGGRVGDMGTKQH